MRLVDKMRSRRCLQRRLGLRLLAFCCAFGCLGCISVWAPCFLLCLITSIAHILVFWTFKLSFCWRAFRRIKWVV